jgi:peptide/nickel transport system ATP-binding protein
VVQKQILDNIKDLSRKLDLSVLFITHDISVIAGLADRLAVMYAGKIVEFGSVNDVFKTPKHPYTAALMSSFPSLKGEKKKLRGIPGSPPDLRKGIKGCSFAPRCPFVFDKCHTAEPALVEASSGHAAACYLVRSEV